MIEFLKKLFGTKSQKDVKELMPILDQINLIYPTYESLSNDDLRAKTAEFKERIRASIASESEIIINDKAKVENDYSMPLEEKERLWAEIDSLEKSRYDKIQAVLNEILPEAFSVVRETARRFSNADYIEVTANEFDRSLAAEKDSVEIVGDKARYSTTWEAGGNNVKWNMIHYDCQMIGGMVLNSGKIAEMATGEGKTLVSTLPVYLNALPGFGVHVVTVNDYLAKRDSDWNGPIYEFHGLTVDCIDRHQPNSAERRKAYMSDITYGTNAEFGFDYLRDNMTGNVDELVQRGHNYAIVDEVDSVLIDDARTPLIISGPTPKGEDQDFDAYKPYVQNLYNMQKSLATKFLTEAKQILAKAEPTSEEKKHAGILLVRAHHGLPKLTPLIKFLSEPGVKSLMLQTEEGFMQNQSKDMHIIDDELYFVISERDNSLEIRDKGIEVLSENFNDPSFFIMPDIGEEVAKLMKMNVSDEERAERKSAMIADYGIKSERLHTVNQLLKAYTLFERDTEYVVMDNKVKIVDEQTGRIMDGRRYSEGLHQAIEAKEGVKVEAATQTYATVTLQNYFRMYKKLSGMTGTAETEAGEFWNIYKLDVVVIPTNKAIARNDWNDLIYKTKREKFNAVIKEIEKLHAEGRPCLVGTTSVENSELLSKMLTLRKIPHNVLNAKLHKKEADIVAQAGQPGMVTISTNMAGRGTDIKLGAGVKEAGGLAIIGTERHESRRVDNQLRGRAGRQGDPGSSQFFVSLEDDLMRLFGSERIAKQLDRLGLDDGEAIQHGIITKQIERAQKKVEENNFGIRKRLIEYDDVMNSQREVIYSRRRNALFGERLSLDVSNMMYDCCEALVTESDNGDFDDFNIDVVTSLAMESPFSQQEFASKRKEQLTEELYVAANNASLVHQQKLVDRVMPVIQNVYKNEGDKFELIGIPITDGKRLYRIPANLKKAIEDEGREVLTAIQKGIALSTIDNAWKEHLREMDDLKQSVQNASYEQKDPLLIYKLESFSLFSKMIQKINRDITAFLMRANLPQVEETDIKEAQKAKTMDKSRIKEQRNDLLSQAHSNTQAQQKTQPIRVEKKVGRNDLCPCGSGLKYKNCHGKGDAEAL